MRWKRLERIASRTLLVTGAVAFCTAVFAIGLYVTVEPKNPSYWNAASTCALAFFFVLLYRIVLSERVKPVRWPRSVALLAAAGSIALVGATSIALMLTVKNCGEERSSQSTEP
jgi:uncharacterized BrkB/YihY/UPF0761 family membrane protein